MRAAAATAALVLALAAGGLAGCGDSPPTGDPEAGARVVHQQLEPSCGRCHSLAAADFEGRVAPNLDALRPGYGRVLEAISTGPGLMPSYEDRLSDEQLHDVAAYISQAASR